MVISKIDEDTTVGCQDFKNVNKLLKETRQGMVEVGEEGSTTKNMATKQPRNKFWRSVNNYRQRVVQEVYKGCSKKVVALLTGDGLFKAYHRKFHFKEVVNVKRRAKDQGNRLN